MMQTHQQRVNALFSLTIITSPRYNMLPLTFDGMAEPVQITAISPMYYAVRDLIRYRAVVDFTHTGTQQDADTEG